MGKLLPRHSVIIITYNQEKLISRALDSVLCQKEFLFEIIVCDDCSTDHNWEVIQKYQNRFPDLIKPFRNNQNLGIFGNIESTWSKPTGDIIWYLSGDDEYCPDLFKNANELIANNCIDFTSGYFTLYFDWKRVDPNGNIKYYKNNLIEKHNPISLKLRGLINNRTTGVSRNMIEKFYPVRKDIGIYADGLIDIQTQLFSEKNYYFPYVGSIYNTQIGIAAKTKRNDHLISYLSLFTEFQKNLKNISEKDKYWINFQKSKTKFKLNKNLKNYLYYVFYFIKSLEPKYGLKRIFIEFSLLIYSPFN